MGNVGGNKAAARGAPDPSNEVARLLALARGEAQAGRLSAAAAACQKILALCPDSPEANHFLGNFYLRQEKSDEAASHYRRALAVRPDVVEIHNNLGGILQDQERLDEALSHFERAVSLNPNLAEVHNNLGGVLSKLDRLDEAAACFQRAIALKPDLAEAHSRLGAILIEQRKLEESEKPLRQAIALSPDLAEPYGMLANSQTQQGKLEEALANYRQAIALKPDYLEAHYGRADLITFRAGDPELEFLESLAAHEDRLPAGQMLFLHFTLGKAWEDVGDYSRAFEHFLRGNALKRREIDYDEAASRREFEAVPEAFGAERLADYRGLGDPSPTPIFVLGMPRSGSTLVEQILAGHPQVHAAGELRNLARVSQAALAAADQSSDERVDAASALQELGRAYVESLPPVARGKTRIVDKAPGNFFNVGLIQLILPNARIIHTTRSPIDTCVSCFSKLFADGQQRYTYDLAELGRYYCRYQQLMDYWRTVLPPGSMLEVAYEDVVDDLEGQARRLIEFCGLPWDPACLSFHQTRRPVFTASVVQVRQPLYRKSLARWRRYEAFLGPLLAELSACGAL